MSDPLAQLHESWRPVLSPASDTISELGDFLRAENRAGRGYLPAGPNVLRAFQQDLRSVRVVVVGQDPYPTPGHAIGLSFAVAPDVRPIPRSLQNIFTEYSSDLGLPRPTSGDLSPWSERGVLLLNRCLTVQPGKPGSHRGRGWEKVTTLALQALASESIVAILWGRDAQQAQNLLGGTPIIASAHPSPMSADRGFFGSRPFSRTNQELTALGREPVDWRLP